jgi:capsular polysaccharide biosynthesis protein
VIEATTDRTVDLSHLLVRVRRRWPTMLGVTAVVLGGALASGLATPATYSATASVAVSPIRFSTAAGTWYTQDVNISTEQAALGSRQVADIASAALHGSVDASTLVRAASVTAPQGSDVLQLTVAANDPRRAASWANALAGAYLTFRAQSAQQAAQSTLASVDVQIAATKPAFVKTMTSLQAQRTALQHVGDGTARVIGAAVAPSAPSSQGLQSFVVGGLVGGLLLGALAALLRDLLDTRARFGRRFGEVLDAETVELRDDEDETARSVLRAVRRAAGDEPVVVTVTAASGSADALLDHIADYAQRTGQRVRVVGADRLPAEQLDGRFGFEPQPSDEIVLLDARHVTSATRLAVLGDASDAAIVVGDASARVRDLRSLARSLRSGGPVRLVPVYLARPAARPATRSRRVRKPVAVTPSA